MLRAVAWTIIILAWLAWAASHSHAATIFPTRYDLEIRAAAKKWCVTYPDWLSLKSQLWQESRLDPNAESSAGAMGISQFTASTWNDITRAMGIVPVSRTVAGPAIDAAAFYMERLRHSWLHAPRPIDDTQRLALSSYNAGLGSLLRAQRRCENAVLWGTIIECLPAITGNANAEQTRTYVIRIAQWRAMMH